MASSTGVFRFDSQWELIKPLLASKPTVARRIFVKHLPNEVAYLVEHTEANDNGQC